MSDATIETLEQQQDRESLTMLRDVRKARNADVERLRDASRYVGLGDLLGVTWAEVAVVAIRLWDEARRG